MMQVEPSSLFSEETGFVIAVRNSYDKYVPASIAAGQSVCVCSNGMFSGEVVLGRRHTVNVWNDLPHMIVSGIQKIIGSWKQNMNRMEGYKQFDLSNSHAHDLIARAFLQGAVSQKQVASVINQWHNPNHPEFQNRNLYSLHNAFTEVWKENMPEVVLQNSFKLHSILDNEVERFSNAINVTPELA
jgi:hypothetical protein